MILDLCPYWTNPPTGGGPERVRHLCLSISRASEVTEVSFRPTLSMMRNGISPLQQKHVTVNRRYSEIQIPHVPAMLAARATALAGMPQDLWLSQTSSLCNLKGVRDLATHATAVQVEHPWQFKYARRLAREKKPLILSAHNCETLLASQQIGGSTNGTVNSVTSRVATLESHALRWADHVISVSDEDIAAFEEILAIDVKDKATVVPNGVDSRQTMPPTTIERNQARRAIGAGKETIALFLGTRHNPNIEAVRSIQQMMPRLENSNIKVIVVGSAGEGMRSHGNLVFTGHVSDYRIYMKAADIALNPLTTGSGTSLKVLEYLAAGLPIVTTAKGVRGLSVKDGTQVVIANLGDFPRAAISLAEDEQLRRHLAFEGRRLAENEYDWEKIGRRLIKSLANLGVVERCDGCAT